MGSKYRLLPALAEVFAQVGGRTALDPFSGSGVVAYILKALGYRTTARDYLKFPTAVAHASCVNQGVLLAPELVDEICAGPNLDGRDFISRTYADRFFTPDDLEFLDSAWSRIARLDGFERSLAIASLVLGAARKQPRGVFTVTKLRYDDGRRHLRMPLSEHFREAAREWNDCVFAGPPCDSATGDVGEAPQGADLVYLDPPYSPPRDDNDYVKRYWFLEGLADYWDDGRAAVMLDTKTRKLPKRGTAFGSRRTFDDALVATLERFGSSTIVLSYSSNSIPSLDTLSGMIADVKAGARPEVVKVRHRYHFGTHAAAARREVDEYIIVAG
jgi:DNA adenine methylase/adenine-specific DNA-methyltransferase